MKQFSERFRKVLSFFRSIAWGAALNTALVTVAYGSDYSWLIAAGGVLWLIEISLCDGFMPLLWPRCYCEIIITRALRQYVPVLDQLHNVAEIDIFQPNPQAMVFGVAMFVASFVPAIGWVFSAILFGASVIYLCLTLCVGFRYLRAYRYNVKNQDKYVPVCQAAEFGTDWPDGTVIQYNLISVAELHQTLSSAFKAAKRRP